MALAEGTLTKPAAQVNLNGKCRCATNDAGSDTGFFVFRPGVPPATGAPVGAEVHCARLENVTKVPFTGTCHLI